MTNVSTRGNEAFNISTLYDTPDVCMPAHNNIPSAPVEPHHASKHGGSLLGLGAGLVITLSVVGTVVAGALIAGLVLIIMKYRKRNQPYQPMDRPAYMDPSI